MTDDLIDENEVARLLGKSVTTIRNWRSKANSYGPSFLKIGHSVRYRLSDVKAWVEGCLVNPSARGERAA